MNAIEGRSVSPNHRRQLCLGALRAAVMLVALAAAGCATGPEAMRVTDVPPCTVQAARAVAPPGVSIGPIETLNPALPAVPEGARLVPASGKTPAYCLVTGSVVTDPASGKTASFGLALPLAWNRKFLFSGCGGYCGVVFQTPPDGPPGGGYPADALAKGYAIAATDGGHASTPLGMTFDASWALVRPGVANEEALTDYYHRATHAVAVAAKQFARRWYSAELARSYFYGCSDGGREAMVEAVRYPEDFDGYIAGAPSFDIPAQVLAGRAARALLDAPDAYIPPERLALIDEAVYRVCDAVDGVRDGLIQNPAKCAFDARQLLCAPGRTAKCLSPGQANTLVAWMSSANDARGRVAGYGYSVSDIYNAAPPGANLHVWAQGAGPPRDPRRAEPWGKNILEQPPGWIFYDQSFKYVVRRDPDADNNNRSAVDRFGIVDEAALSLLEARTQEGTIGDPRRLAPLVASNRKMILFHGYSDGFVSPFGTVRFYVDWAGVAGGYEALAQHARLFMVPGMYHCGGGPGPNAFDALGALERWVEAGAAPQQIVAVKHANDDPAQPVQRAMPLCPFPAQARYNGRGDVNDAASWSCTPNEELLDVGPNGVAAGLTMLPR